MGFKDISRSSLDRLSLSFRTEGVLPGPVPPGRGSASAPQDPTRFVASEALRAFPFFDILGGRGGETFARQYQVVATLVTEPEFSARGPAQTWTPGKTVPFGEELTTTGARFKKLSATVRVDPLMVPDMVDAQVRLAATAVKRALEEATWHSNPASDDEASLSGLPAFLESSQEVFYNPTRGLIGGMSELETRCHPSDGDTGSRADVFAMSSRARWRLLKELEDKGVTPDFAECGFTGTRQLHFHGIPVLEARVPEPASSDEGTAVWALKLTGPSGVKVLHIGGLPEEYGVQERDVGPMITVDASGESTTATEAIEVFTVVSVLVPESASIARLSGVPIGDPFSQP